ncbi:MAG: hypothetical protein HIU88_13595 [Acidobacteria bacterium]|nr:hypothetical protein [Acidobacteriota bacterium]
MSDQSPAATPEHPDSAVVDVAAEPVAASPVEPEAVEPGAVEPEAVAPELVEPAAPAAATGELPSATDEVPAASPEPEPVASPGTATPRTAVPEASAVPVQQLVYVPLAVPPKKRGNRGIGTLLAVVGALLFAGIYTVVGALIIDVRDGDLFGPEFTSFVSSAFFWVPVSLFLVGLILMVLLLNRAGWWAHVFGSLILAVAVYFGMIGILLLIANVFQATPTPITYESLALNPWVIAAAVVAREASIWTGLGIAARGRRVKARSIEERATFDREQEAKRAEYAGTVAGA